jgi:ATP-binding cassette subfamily G (WHITE) protein 2 (SNQ2)
MVERYARRATSVFGHRSEPSRKLLHYFRGHIKAGEMLMVIGRPGSGCTTFLKSLCHMHAEYKSTTGTLLYGGIQANFEEPAAPVETTFCGKNCPPISQSQSMADDRGRL